MRSIISVAKNSIISFTSFNSCKTNRNQLKWIDVAVAYDQISEQVMVSTSMSSGKKFNFLFNYLLTVRI